MIGRAGRYGFDTEADAILCCYPNEKARAIDLMTRKLERVESCLSSEQRGLSRLILEAIGIGLVSDQHELKEYLQSTLLFTQT
jgi:replicative superfamily II helicase